MKKYPFSDFKIVTSPERSEEIPFILTKEQYRYFTQDEDEWCKCLRLIEANGFNCIYVLESITDKGHKVWEVNNV